MSEYIVRIPSDMPYEIKAELYAWYVNSEPIVRCRDCKEFAFGSDEYATADWCDYWDAYVESPDGFCAWGERREDA